MDNDGRGQELPYGHGSPEQYQHQYQQFQGHDKSGFSNQITEQNQVPVQSPVLDPDQKRPQQW